MSEQSDQEAAGQIPQPSFALVAIAASAGGLNAITHVLGDLPGDLPVPVVVVQHLDPRHRSLMVEILSRRTPLRVKEAEEGDRLCAGTVYIAPPNRHLLVQPGGTLSLAQTELVHFVRPSADRLFESVATSYKEKAIAVVLTGTGSDGEKGFQAVHRMGGATLAQDPRSAEYAGMPAAAVQTGAADLVLPLEEIAPALLRLIRKGAAA